MKVKRIISILLVSIMYVSILSIHTSAYQLLPGRVTKGGVMIPSKNLSSSSISHMSDALNRWNNTAGVTILTISSSRHSDDNSTYKYGSNNANKDKKHQIYKEVRVDIDAVAECTSQPVTDFWLGIKLESSDVLLNMKYNYANSAQPNAYDTGSVFQHESGHAIGIDHPEAGVYSTASIMYPVVFTNTTRRYLYQDDKNAVIAKNY